MGVITFLTLTAVVSLAGYFFFGKESFGPILGLTTLVLIIMARLMLNSRTIRRSDVAKAPFQESVIQDMPQALPEELNLEPLTLFDLKKGLRCLNIGLNWGTGQLEIDCVTFLSAPYTYKNPKFKSTLEGSWIADTSVSMRMSGDTYSFRFAGVS